MLLNFYRKFKEVLSQKISTALAIHDQDGAPTTKEIEFWLKQLSETELKIIELENAEGATEWDTLPVHVREKIEQLIAEHTHHE